MKIRARVSQESLNSGEGALRKKKKKMKCGPKTSTKLPRTRFKMSRKKFSDGFEGVLVIKHFDNLIKKSRCELVQNDNSYLSVNKVLL